jgi:maltooligosyltrehalose trehalohydrolase
VRVAWQAQDRRLLLDANLSPNRVEFPLVDVRPFWRCGDTEAALGPWSVRWTIESA